MYKICQYLCVCMYMSLYYITSYNVSGLYCKIKKKCIWKSKTPAFNWKCKETKLYLWLSIKTWGWLFSPSPSFNYAYSKNVEKFFILKNARLHQNRKITYFTCIYKLKKKKSWLIQKVGKIQKLNKIRSTVFVFIYAFLSADFCSQVPSCWSQLINII